MNAINTCPFPPAWTPQQIAGAVKPRVFELDFAPVDVVAGNAANRAGSRGWHAGYVRQPALAPRFRMHG